MKPVHSDELHYEIHGQGEPLLLLHGFTGCGADWKFFGEEWCQGFQVITPDMWGHGRSVQKNSPAFFSFSNMAQDLFALLDRLKIKKIKAIGCSGGGGALLHMATQQPDRIEAMVIVSATSYYPEQAREIMRQVSVDSLTPEQWEILKSRHIQGEEQIRHLYLQARNFAEESEDMNFSSEDLSKIKARTLIVQGDRDPLFPLDISIEMYKAIPNSALWIVPNGGHGPIFGDAADYFKKTAISYLKNELQN